MVTLPADLFDKIFGALFSAILLDTTGLNVLLLVAIIAFLVVVMLLIKDFFWTLIWSPLGAAESIDRVPLFRSGF